MKVVEKIKTYISCERLFSQKSCHLQKYSRISGQVWSEKYDAKTD